MLLGIDHLVIAVRDPDTAAAELERDAGLSFTGGGRHEAMGTWNRLAFLGDTYLELIGVFDRALVLSSHSFAVGRAALAILDEGFEGLATWALATDGIHEEVARLHAAGSSIGAPAAGSRVRSDGEVVRWHTAFPELGREEPPFLTEHEYAGPEWGEAARATRDAFRHPAGGPVRLVVLTLPVGDPGTVAARYAAVVGVAFEAGGRATVGEQTIELVTRADGTPPVVDLVADSGTPALDLVRLGVRWRRRAGD